MLEALKAMGEARLPYLYALACRVFDLKAARDPGSEINLLPLFVQPGETACDIGANHGLFTFFLLRRNVRVLAFEPNPRMVRILKYRFAAAIGRGDLQLFDCALSDEERQSILHVPKGFSPLGTLDGALVGEGGSETENIAVPVRRLDAAVRETVSFIKLDVEGHEARVLRGAEQLLRASHPTLLVEAEERHRPGAVALVKSYLAPLGYTGLYIEDGKARPLSSFDPARHQQPDAINAADNRVRQGHIYINNFIFVARPDVKARLAARWPDLGADLRGNA
ncbi:FkbM family methyltransferase [Aquabacter sp. CN5-332]|uniref:FkbM family methyltransferase n=1 Tax=Aquabacter sp. CN5-332 TaxID=3156608 RepID=UPI0032B3E7BF